MTFIKRYIKAINLISYLFECVLNIRYGKKVYLSLQKKKKWLLPNQKTILLKPYLTDKIKAQKEEVTK